MGFKPWHNLSILLLAGAAMVGCNNTQKDKTTIAPPPNTPGATKVPDNTSPFPTVNKQFSSGNPYLNNTNTGLQPNTPNFPQSNGMPQNPPQFAPMNTNLNSQPSSFGPSSVLGSKQSNAFAPSTITPPSQTPPNSTFGIDQRNTASPVLPPLPNQPNPMEISMPPGMQQRN